MTALIECKHEPDGMLYLSDPPKFKCAKCGDFYLKNHKIKMVPAGHNEDTLNKQGDDNERKNT